MSICRFKEKYTLSERQKESSRVLAKYPQKIPIIVEPGSESVPQIDKEKYLVPSEMTIGQFQFVIRKRLSLNSESALFIFINNSMQPTGELLSNVYNNHKDEDNFLYITYCLENTFG